MKCDCPATENMRNYECEIKADRFLYKSIQEGFQYMFLCLEYRSEDIHITRSPYALTYSKHTRI